MERNIVYNVAGDVNININPDKMDFSQSTEYLDSQLFGTRTIDVEEEEELFALFCNDNQSIVTVFNQRQWGLIRDRLAFISEEDFNQLYNSGKTKNDGYIIYPVEELLA